jgi:hypothetical protein
VNKKKGIVIVRKGSKMKMYDLVQFVRGQNRCEILQENISEETIENTDIMSDVDDFNLQNQAGCYYRALMPQQ